ncbi:ATPase [Planctomycetota bacterium]|nr:ATPase [Planctomycetota bacterium]
MNPSVADPSTLLTGLAQDEARRRMDQEGANVLPAQEKRGLFIIAWEVVKEPMFLLLVAAGTLYLLMGEPGDAAMLLGFVFVVMGITIVQERRTERSLDALRDLSSPQSLVIRDGERRRIPAKDLVRGDLIVLAEGDRVPADAVLRDGLNMSADESLLTGESVPVSKKPSASAQVLDVPGGDDLPSVFSGTLITAGQGIAEVLATGLRSELGKIGKALSQVQPERTLLQIETGRLVRYLAILGLVLCGIVVVVYALTRGSDAASWKQGFLAGITMAMATLPEELPVILTIFLALGAWRISRSRVLTRRMPAIETLGAATVLCTDKTGTLTRNQMTVTRILIGDRQIDLEQHQEQEGADQPADVQALLDLAILASKSDPFDPMERAIHAAGSKAAPGIAERHPGWKLEREYPLTPELLAVTQAWSRGSGEPLLVASKGAPEAIAGLCGLSPERRKALEQQVTALAGEGLRVLGVAKAAVPTGKLPSLHHDLRLEFVGLIGLSDPLRANVPAAVAECQTAGIRVIMITGDYPATALSIARQAGITNHREVITGAELAGMTVEELSKRIRTVQVFARVVPAQKLRIVEALKTNREVVAMTGDGVNDAPALKAAHIGIAMGGRGTDVARESAALVLLDDDFASIVAAVKMGRRIFDNIKKAIAFTFAVHVPIAGLSMLPVFIPSWPLLLLPVHIVFLELVIDPSCTLIYEAEQAEKDIMSRPPRDPGERLFSWKSLALSLMQGMSVLAVCVGIFYYSKTDHGDDAARALTFTALVTSFIAIIVTNRSWSISLLGILRTPNAAQWWVVLGTIASLTLVLCLPVARNLFHFAPLHALDLTIAVSAGLLCVGWIEILKYVRRRRT